MEKRAVDYLTSQNKGVTLMVLIITIIILLILSGVIIAMITGQNSLLLKSKQTKERTEYTNAKERITIELTSIRMQCVDEGVEYNVVEVEKLIKNVNDIAIEKYYYTESNLDGIVISVKEYSMYKFLLDKNGDITGVLQGKINDDTKQEQFKNLDDFERDNFGQKIDSTGDNNDEESSRDKIISYMLNSKILDEKNNRYTQLTDTTGNNNNASMSSIDSNDEKNGIIFNGVSNIAKINLNKKLTFPVTMEMMVKTSNENRTEIYYMEPNLGIAFGSWRIIFYFDGRSL